MEEPFDPMSKEDITRSLGLLTDFEKEEIGYVQDDVYFLGLTAKKISPPVRCCKAFDDASGFYQAIPHDHINFRYEILRPINKGVFSEVILAHDHKYKRDVAIKISKTTNDNELVFYEETHKLYVLGKEFEDDDNILKMLDHFMFRGHPCVVFEALLQNLSEELKRTPFQCFPLPVVKEILISVLQSLMKFSTIGLVHCDLKVENLVMMEPDQYKVKILDFGSSVFEDVDHLAHFQCRTDCSPELAFRMDFGLSSDMWSVGCLAVKLFTGTSSFKAETEEEYILKIVSVIGLPPRRLLADSKIASDLFQAVGFSKHYWEATDGQKQRLSNNLISLPYSNDLSKILSKSESPEFIDFVSRCICWEPTDRMSSEEALDHPWIKAED